MIHLSIHIGVVCLLDRYFSDDVVLDPIHLHIVSFLIHERIEVRLYEDLPMHLALYYVDGVPILKENMIEYSPEVFIDRTKNNENLSNFLLEYVV